MRGGPGKARRIITDPMLCKMCGQSWPLEFFPIRSDGKPHTWCDTCVAESNRTAQVKRKLKAKAA